MKGSILTLVLLILALISCSKTPEHVINEDNMARLMADIHKAEAMIEDESNASYNDSMKLTLRQSIFMKHNVTQAQFDTSLIWYSHHLDIYEKVYDDVLENLNEDLKEVSKGDFSSVSKAIDSDIKPSLPRFRTVGDTADIWGKSRTWVMLPGFVQNIITFDRKPDKENMKGDKYELAFKMINPRKALMVFLGVDYKDGSTAYIYRSANSNGWKHYKLQSDSTREVVRIYGYLSYKSVPTHPVFVDSIELLRTHLDRKAYNATMTQQKSIKSEEKDDKKKSKLDELKASSKVKRKELSAEKVEKAPIAKKLKEKQLQIENKK